MSDAPWFSLAGMSPAQREVLVRLRIEASRYYPDPSPFPHFHLFRRSPRP